MKPTNRLKKTEYQLANKRVSRAAFEVRTARGALEDAEDEWHEALKALDALENQPYPSVVRNNRSR